MDVRKPDASPSRRAPSQYFTGTVWQNAIIDADEPARVMALKVSFEPGARTAWHTHPLGQTLHVLAGIGRVQRQGGPIEEIRAGDTVWIEPGEVHWHGAAPSHGMTHIAIQEKLNGSPVEWLDKVSDEDYGGS